MSLIQNVPSPTVSDVINNPYHCILDVRIIFKMWWPETVLSAGECTESVHALASLVIQNTECTGMKCASCEMTA